MINNNIFIHIGLAKTSTSHIQKLFSTIEYDNFLYNHEIFDEMYKVIKLFASKQISFDDPQIKILKDKLSNFFLNNKDKFILYSNEGLSSPAYGFLNFDYHQQSIMLLNYFIPEAKIILFLREHKRWIISLYKQSVQQGNFQTFNEFIYDGDLEVNSFNSFEKGKLPKLSIKQTQFKKLIKNIEKFYGEKNLFIFKYESIKENYQIFFEKIMHLIFPTNISEIKLNKIPINIKTYRSLSGLSIMIILVLKTILKSLVIRMNYNTEVKLINFNNIIHDHNILIKYFNWTRIRKLFQNYLDKICYIDFGFTNRKIRILEKYQDFFDKDGYKTIKTYK